MIETPSQPLLRSPLHETVERAGARFLQVGGWQLPEAFTQAAAEADAARRGVGLADLSGLGKLSLEGLAAADLLQELWGLVDLAVGSGTVVQAGRAVAVFRLRPDHFLLHTAAGEADALAGHLQPAIDAVAEPLTLTDITHGRAEIWAVGPASPALLSRLCGLDFSPAAFPDLSAKATSVAKTPQLILRRDLDGLPAYALVGARSLGAYLWGTMMEAGGDLGLVPVGYTALRSLAGN